MSSHRPAVVAAALAGTMLGGMLAATPAAAQTSQYWDGSNTTPGNDPQGRGGSGTWNAGNTNWTNAAGDANSTWTSGNVAVFTGAPPTAGDAFIVSVVGAQTIGGLNFTGGPSYLLQDGGSGALVTGPGDFTVNVDGDTFGFIEAGIGVTIQGDGRLVRTGAGGLTLSVANSYTGGTSLTGGGANQVRATGALGTGPVTLSGRAPDTSRTRLSFLGAGVTAEALDITVGDGGLLQFDSGATGGTATITNQNGGVVEIDNGSLGSATVTNQGGGIVFFSSLAGAGAGAGGTIVNAAGATIDVTTASTTMNIGSLSGAGTVLLGNRSLAIGGIGRDEEFSGVIQGDATSTLLKGGAGTLTLSGTNTYTGNTFVTGGTLNVTGSLANGSMIVFTTLTGTGSIAGTTTIQGGATLRGAAGQQLTLQNLVLNNTTQVGVTLGAPSDTALFDVTGNLTLDGNLLVTGGAGFAEGAYRLFDYGGALTNNGLVISSLPAGFNPGDWAIDASIAGQVTLLAQDGPGLQYWDGANSTPGGVANGRGGNGTWNSASTNWTNADGTINAPWAGETAVFTGNPGPGTSFTVQVDGAQTVTGLTILTGARYNFQPGTDGAFVTSGPDFVIDVADFDGGVIDAVINVPIQGGSRLVKTGDGSASLLTANSYTGGTLVQGGVLQVRATGALGTGPVTVADTARLTFRTVNARADGLNIAVEGGGTLYLLLGGSAGTAQVNNAGYVVVDDGGSLGTATVTNQAGGEVQFSGDGDGATARILNGAGADVDLSQSDGTVSIGSLSGAGDVRLGGSALTVGGSNLSSETIGGVVSDGGLAGGIGGSLIKTGNGTLTLTGANTYTGGTTLNAGGLVVNGSILGNVVVNGGTLGGGGTIGGTVSFAGSAVLQGQSGTTLSLGALTLGANSNVNVTLGAPSATALFDVAGNLTLDGILNVSAGAGFGSGTFRLFDYGGALTDAGLVVTTVPVGYNPGDWTLDTATAGQVSLIVPGGTGSGTQYWDGSNSTPGGVANGRGGNGTWNAANTNWTNLDGTINAPWAGGIAGFAGTSSYTVTIDAAGVSADSLSCLECSTTFTGGTLTLADGAAFDVIDVDTSFASSLTFRSNVIGLGAITKSGRGSLFLSGNNSFNGILTITGGLLSVIDSTNADATIDLGGFGVVIDGGTSNATRSTFTMASRTQASTGGAVIARSAGSFGAARVLSGSVWNAGANDVIVGDAGNGVLQVYANSATNISRLIANRVVLGAQATGRGDLQIWGDGVSGVIEADSIFGGTGGGTVTFDNLSSTPRANPYNLMPTLDGNLSVTFLNGEVRLSGTNTYTGATVVDRGFMILNGASLTGGGAVEVRRGALGGNGSIAGAVTVLNTGTLEGAAGGTLTLGSLVLNNNSQVNVGLGAPSGSALFAITGDFTLDGLLNVSDAGGFATGSYRLFDYGGALTNNGLVITTLPAGFNPGDWILDTATAGQVNLLVPATSTGEQYWDGANTTPGGVADGRGGNGTWNAANTNWTNQQGLINAPWASEVAVFQGVPGVVTIEGQQTFTGLRFLIGSNYSFNAGASGELVTTGSQAEVNFAGTDIVTIAAPISGTGGIHQTGPGLLQLTGTNNYTGGTTISGGTLLLNVAGTLGTGGVLLDGGTLSFSRTDAATYANLISGSGQVGINSGIVTLTADNSYTGLTAVGNGATLQLGNDTATGSIVSDLRVSGTGQAVWRRTANTTYNGVISGNGVFAMSGQSADITLTADSSGFTGRTDVAAGTLVVTGSLGGTLNIQRDGALTGTGSVGDTTIATGFGQSGLLIGRAGDTLTLASLVLTDQAEVEVALGAPGNAALFDVTGNLTLDGILDVSDAGGFGDGVYRIFNYGGALTDNGLDLGTIAGGAEAELQTSVASQVNLVVGQSTGPAPTMLFWDGTQTAANGAVDGGPGTWDAVNTNWTLADGSANQTWSGVMAIFQGAGAAVAVDDGEGPIQATGLQFAGTGWTLSGDAIELTGTATIRVGDGSAASADYVATIGSVLTGTGTISKTDRGTLVLTGANTFSGPTIVNGGTLIVNGSLAGAVTVQTNAVIGGSGSIGNLTIGTGGIVAPGNSIGTLTVNGDYVQAVDSVYRVEINPAGQSDLIDITGTATIQGGTVAVTKAPGTYLPDTRFTILTADGGVTGTYAGLTQDAPFVNLALAYDANNVFIDVTRNNVSFCDVAATLNQCATGGGVESLAAGTLYDAVVSLPDDAAARAAFDALSGDIYASARGAMLADARLPRSAVLSRLATAEPGNGAWARAFGNWGGQDGDGNAFGLDHDTTGLVVGADFAAGGNWRFGLAAGYTHDSLDAATGTAEGTLDGTHLLAYAGGAYGPVRIRAGIGYADFDLDVSRVVAFTGFTDGAHGKVNGNALQGFAELGYAFALGGAEAEPYAGLAAVRLRTDAFGETGGPAALNGARQSDSSTFSTLGVRLATRTAGPVTFDGAIAWRHAFGDVVPTARFAFPGGDAFTLAGTPLNRDEAAIEAGLSFQIAPGLALGARYEGAIGSRADDHSVQGAITLRF